MRKILLILFLDCTSLIVCLAQTDEFQYFYHPQYFSKATVTNNKFSKITVTSYWTRPEGRMYQDQQTVYTYNRSGELICSETYYFKPHKPEVITQQTIDCNEYENGLQVRHLRYHNNRDSAEWIEEFYYEFDDRRNIIRTVTKDLNYPHNSSERFQEYDDQNRLIKSWTSYDYSTEYSYDQNGNLTETVWGPKDGRRNRNIYKYDSAGNMVEYEFKGTGFDNFDVVRTINEYDSLGSGPATFE